MTTVSIAQAWPSDARPFTVHDLDRMPDDGRRYELLDGALLVSPAPAWGHQEVAAALLVRLREHCPKEFRALPGPVGIRLADDTELQPDVVVAHQRDFGLAYLPKPPVLAVEVRSPSTALVDRNLKKAAYERFGVPSYWVVDPDLDKPRLVAFELQWGAYVEIAHVTSEEVFEASRPFPVSVVPAQLAVGLWPH